MAQVAQIAKKIADTFKVGHPRAAGTHMGPVVNRGQWNKIQAAIQNDIDEGATVATGGLGLPRGTERGFYVRPTIFADVTNGMTIAREEIFGPVLAIIGTEDEHDAVRIANDTPYGLAAYVFSASTERARQVGRLIRAGDIYLQGASLDAPHRLARTNNRVTVANGVVSVWKTI